MDLVNSHIRGVCKGNKVKKKRKLRKALRLVVQEDAVDTMKSESNFSLQCAASESKSSERPSAFIVMKKPRQKRKLLRKNTPRSDGMCMKGKLGKNFTNKREKSNFSDKSIEESKLDHDGRSNYDSLHHGAGNTCSDKKGEPFINGDIVFNKNMGILKKSDKTESKSTNEIRDKKQCKKEVNFLMLMEKSVTRRNKSTENNVNQTVKKRKSKIAQNTGKNVRKSVVVPKTDSYFEKKEEKYVNPFSIDNDKPSKFSNKLPMNSSKGVERQYQQEEIQSNDSFLDESKEQESGLNYRLPVCIEMDSEGCIPSNFFEDSSTNSYSYSVNSIVSGDDLFSQKLNNIKKVKTNNWEVKVVNIKSSWNNDNNIKNYEDQEETHDHFETKEEPITSFKIVSLSENQLVLVLPPGETVNLRGVLKLKILLGSVRVLGYTMSQDETRTLYSPLGFTFLKISNNSSVTEDQGNFKALKEKYWQGFKKISGKYEELNINLRKFNTFSTIILMENAASYLLETFAKFVKEPIFDSFSKTSSNVTKCLRAHIFKSINASNSDKKNTNENIAMYGKDKLSGEAQWDTIVNDTADFLKYKRGALRFATFGGKGVGKSTFLRFIVNQLVSQKKKVLFIDLDPGQCEFTPPGCLSAVVINEPLLGPNFTHFTQPVRCVYFGEIQVVNQLTAYLECVKYIYDWCSSQESLANIPWCINTMGFPRGYGLEIAHYTINLIRPSHVVQIKSGWKLNNFECLLNSHNVKEMETKYITLSTKWDPEYHFYSIDSAVEKENERDSIKTWPPHVLRNFAVVAYFNSVMSESNSLLAVKPHVIRFQDIKLCVCHEKINHSDYLNAINANLVALCNVGSGKGLIPSEPGYPEIWSGRPLGPCYGMGIVRGIDMIEKVIFLISPVSKEELNNVNCLVLGAVTIPSNMILAQDEAEGEIPYVMKGLHEVLHNLGMQGKEWDA